MWQVVLAAAVAGSGLFLKRLHDSNSSKTHFDSSSKPSDQIVDQFIKNSSKQCQDSSIFRLSTASGSLLKSSRKKSGFVSRGNDVDEKCGLVVDLKTSRRRFVVCFNKKNKKKRSNCRYASEKCPPKGDSSFALGFGAGVMCMMSAKSEISKLNTAIDKTTKVVEELKTQVARRKSSRGPDISSFRADGNANTKRSRNNCSLLLNRISSGNILDSRPDSSFRSNEGECGSSCLTEDLQSGVSMDQLEAELQSELQKLPWCTAEAYGPARGSDYFETEVLAEEFDSRDNPDLKTYQDYGVLPSELDQKLSHVFLEQQESQITELESKLQQSHSKHNDKEVELQTLKDCIRRLTEVSLDSASDGETEAREKSGGEQ
ncbi:Protein POLAR LOCALIZATION DURING ASYMMETRIC DIVISION AND REDISTRIBUTION [Heracleum sosnowskyi]|uniref:Protein POLAR LOCALIZATION DURING ASYMMETRIC DIVISION AND REDISTRIBUTION n=1 Tax=Heracleum sosnowskyi TaxID=360622 RepID=A0AAD8IPM3_9APIA|nr:Protein POLAR LOCALIZATION DURING ASYMMETRIC DIVISION AND REDISTRIBUTION [Heracleum sosnowskyi]